VSWRITKISNARHEVTVSHKDGTEHAFVIPEEHRESSDKKIFFIKSKIEEQDSLKKAKDSKELKELNKDIKKINPLWYLAILQALAIFGLLCLRFK
jgi:hypothetical protein